MTLLPGFVRGVLTRGAELLELGRAISDPRVLAALAPSAVRGLVLREGARTEVTLMPAAHHARLDWRYPLDNPEMRRLWERANAAQWNLESDLPWGTSVDPLDPDVPLLSETFLDFPELERLIGTRLEPGERRRLQHSVVAWLLSQFLHGEQGALFAAAQVTECVPFFDGKLYGATQVMDEGRHVEVFRRYTEDKLHKLYPINDNLFVIIDALMRDGRWDMKFLGMQIMVEGLALGAFGCLYRETQEPLLRELLRNVMRDEGRHVHYGVLSLRDHFTRLSERERSEREEWAFEVALLMRNRFLLWEVYEEWFEGRMPRAKWRRFVETTPGMRRFRRLTFGRLVPNLREIGLVTPRMRARYEKHGMAEYLGGVAANHPDAERLISQSELIEDGE